MVRSLQYILNLEEFLIWSVKRSLELIVHKEAGHKFLKSSWGPFNSKLDGREL